MATKYKKCMDCPFFENKCYEDDSVIGICNKYNCVTSPENTCLTHKRHNHSNYDPELNDTSLPPGVTTKMGAASLSPPLMYKGGTRQPMRGKRQRRVARTALGSEHLDIATKDPSPTHQMAKREHHPMPSNTPSYHDSLRQPLLCPDDCPSKKFCDPSSCALESVREANMIVNNLKHHQEKKYVKAHTLSKKMKISPSLAGQILKVMDEWSKYTHGRSKATWVRGDVL